MGLAAWIELIGLVLKFPDSILQVARLFQKTPEEKHDALVADIQKQAQAFEESGRPA